MGLRWPLGLLLLCAIDSLAQAPAPPAVPADLSPLHVVTYIELKPTAKTEGAALLKSWREAQRHADGNLRAEVVQSSMRPGQFVLIAAWKNKAAFDAHAGAAEQFRDKLSQMTGALYDERLYEGLD